MIRTILIDCQTASRNLIKEVISSHCDDLKLLDMFDNDELSPAKLNELKPDLVLLDPETNGSADLFKLLGTKENGGCELIFITSNHNGLHHDLKQVAFDYIIRPVDPENTKKVLKRFATIHQLNGNISEYQYSDHGKKVSRKIILNTAQKLHVVDMQEIIRCEADKNYTHFYLNDGSKVTICKSLNYCENLLPEHSFLRTHKSHLVNMNFIRSVIKKDGGYLVLLDGANIPVSFRRKEMVSRVIHEVFRQI